MGFYELIDKHWDSLMSAAGGLGFLIFMCVALLVIYKANS